MISMAPTAYMSWCGVKGSGSDSTGARYLSQLTMRWKNLSAPNRMGATVNAARRIMNACSAGSAALIRATRPSSAFEVAEVGWVLVMVMVPFCWGVTRFIGTGTGTGR